MKRKAHLKGRQMSENICTMVDLLTRQLQRGRVITVETRSEGDDYIDIYIYYRYRYMSIAPLPTNKAVMI